MLHTSMQYPYLDHNVHLKSSNMSFKVQVFMFIVSFIFLIIIFFQHSQNLQITLQFSDEATTVSPRSTPPKRLHQRPHQDSQAGKMPALPNVSTTNLWSALALNNTIYTSSDHLRELSTHKRTYMNTECQTSKPTLSTWG